MSAELRPRVRHALDEQAAILRQLAALPVQPAGLARAGAAARPRPGRGGPPGERGRRLPARRRRGALRARLAAQEERAGKAAPALAEQVELVESPDGAPRRPWTTSSSTSTRCSARSGRGS